MILRKESIPYKLFGLKALERRLLSSSGKREWIVEELRVVQAGVNGERKLRSIFEKYTFPFEYYVFHDLHLQSAGKFQIDTLFLSRFGAVILEMKNIGGQLHFPEDRFQIVRTLEDGKTDSFECPSVQLERNKMLLGDWLHVRQISMPIQGAVVFARPQQQFANTRKGLRILFPLEVPGYLRSLENSSKCIDATALKETVTALLAANRAYNPFPICSTYQIDPRHIATGVLCKTCGLFGMIRISRGWVCESCGHIDRHAHRQAIADRFMLLGGALTNRECRQFLHIQDSDVAKRLLKGMPISYQGTNKGRKYWMELKDIEECLSK